MSCNIPLDQVVLLFVPPASTTGYKQDAPLDEPYLIQVRIQSSKLKTLEDSIVYAAAQSEISQSIHAILVAHILSPFTKGDRLPGCEHLSDGDVVVDGKDYTLHGFFEPWEYGRTLVAKWGESETRTCKDKWNFLFKIKKVSARDHRNQKLEEQQLGTSLKAKTSKVKGQIYYLEGGRAQRK